MANSVNNIPQVTTGQRNKEATTNQVLAAAFPALAFGIASIIGRVVTYIEGNVPIDGKPTYVAGGTWTLTVSATNYVYLTRDGSNNPLVVIDTAPPAGWPGPLADPDFALYDFTVGASLITAWNDWRVAQGPTGPRIEMAINSQTGTTYTLVASDTGRCVEMSNASANTLTVPPNASVAFNIGTQVLVRQMGAGLTSIAAGAGVTIRTPSTLNLTGQYAEAVLHKRGTNEWVLGGRIA